MFFLFFLVVNSKYVFYAFATTIPKKDKKDYGDDAFLYSETVLAVADGVGGCRKFEINPAFYSAQLMENIKNMYPQNPQKYNSHPKKLMKKSISANSYKGSSTLIVATIDQKNDSMRIANLGDSALLHLRPDTEGYKVIFRSKTVSLDYNTPAQACHEYWNPDLVSKGESKIAGGDLVIVGSDGMFDNLFECHIVDFINRNQGKKIQKVVKNLAKLALKFSEQQDISTPFEVNTVAYGKHWVGGKRDDITVMIAVIGKNSQSF